MIRQQATEELRDLLDEHGLKDWSIRLVQSGRFLGLCDYKRKVIWLNTFSIDTHPDTEVRNTIKHEVAHAIVGYGHGHDDVWKEKAKELGCDNTFVCGMSLSSDAIDAIRSGDSLEVFVEENVVRNVTYKRGKLLEKCDICGKDLIETKSTEKGEFRTIYYKCGHFKVKQLPKKTPFESVITSDANPFCNHEWVLNRCLKCPANKPFTYQAEGARNIELAFGRHGIFDEQGLGKTIQSLIYLRFHPETWPVLFIVKSAIKYQWASEIMRWISKDAIPMIFSSGKQRPIKGPKFYIISYDMLRRFDTKSLIECGIQTIICDEVQAVKNPDSTRTNEVRNLVRNVKHFIPLSGTPWKNRGSEYFPVLNMLDSAKFPSYNKFEDEWVDYYFDGAKYKQGGIRRIEDFRIFTKGMFTRRERSEVDVEFPELRRTKFNHQLDETSQVAYDEEVSAFVKEWNQVVLNGGEDEAANQMVAIAALNRMRHMLGLSKIPATMELLEEFFDSCDRKIVVFVHHIDVGDIIERNCKKDFPNIPVMRLRGDMGGAERFAIQNKFNETQTCIMIASTLAAGEGMNLQTCSDCIIHERQWNPANEEQVEGRFVRIGSTANKVVATYVHAMNSIDTKFDNLVENKRINFHNTMNKGERLQWIETDMIKELIRDIMENHRKAA